MQTTTYNFLLSPGPAIGLYWAQLLPVGAFGRAEIATGAKHNLAILDTKGPVNRFYTVDHNEIEQPLSAIYFWLKYKKAQYGEILSTNLMAKAVLTGDLDQCATEAVCLDLTISEKLLQDAEDVAGETIIDFEPWEVAKKIKAIKTSFLSLYNNHNFYTITDTENE